LGFESGVITDDAAMATVAARRGFLGGRAVIS
jgi:hypothetical protein